jgi:hypothetical protein
MAPLISGPWWLRSSTPDCFAHQAEGIELLTSSKTSTGYRCVSGTLVQGLGVMSYEVVANKDGKKVSVNVNVNLNVNVNVNEVVPNKDGKKVSATRSASLSGTLA